jgi:hypothetical protein
MDKAKIVKAQRLIKNTNALEALKDIGASTTRSLKEDLVQKVPENFIEQLFGPKLTRNFSGEINPGEALEISEVFTGRHEEKQKLQRQLTLERRLREEESIRIEKRTNELKIHLKVLMEEITVLAENTQNLGTETQIAAMQAPVEPGVYHIIFFEKLIEFIKSFAKKIEEAGVWLHASNKRAEKKNYWATYKKHGGKFLLSGEHYLQRSAG